MPNPNNTFYFGGYDMAGMQPHRTGGDGTVYSKIASLVAGVGPYVNPHHPFTCTEWFARWELGEDGMACKHASVPITDEKLQAALNASIGELLIDFAWEFKGLSSGEAKAS